MVVTLKDPPSTLRPGLNATADITTDRRGQGAGGARSRRWWCGEIDKDGKVVDPGAVQAGEPENPNEPRQPQASWRRRKACSW